MSRPFRISWSRINSWKQCRWAYHMGYELNLAPKIVAPALRDGRVYHECLSYIYARWPDVSSKKLIAKVVRYGMDGDVELKMIGYVTNYLRHINRYKAQEPEQILANEFPFEVMLDLGRINDELSVPYESAISFIGIMDLIVLRRGRGEIWDHKLQSSQPSSTALDHPAIAYPQIPLYLLASIYLGAGMNHFQLNIMAKRRKTNPQCRYPTLLTDEEIYYWENWLYEMVIEITEAKSHDCRPKNVGSLGCGWCGFKFACVKHMSEGGDGLKQAITEAYEKKTFGKGGMPKWKREFPERLLEELT